MKIEAKTCANNHDTVPMVRIYARKKIAEEKYLFHPVGWLCTICKEMILDDV